MFFVFLLQSPRSLQQPGDLPLLHWWRSELVTTQRTTAEEFWRCTGQPNLYKNIIKRHVNQGDMPNVQKPPLLGIINKCAPTRLQGKKMSNWRCIGATGFQGGSRINTVSSQEWCLNRPEFLFDNRSENEVLSDSRTDLERGWEPPVCHSPPFQVFTKRAASHHDWLAG